MQITRQTEYAVRTVLELSGLPFGEFIQIKDVAEKHKIPEMFLKKTVQALARSGLVVTQRGTNGGVRLARSADKITLVDVYAAIEGQLALNVCLADNYQCENQSSCQIHKILRRAQDALVRELSKETFADIAAKSNSGTGI